MIDAISKRDTIKKLIYEVATTIYEELKKMSNTYGELENRIFLWKTENSWAPEDDLSVNVGKVIFETINQLYKDEVASLKIQSRKEANSLADELTSKLVQEKEIALDGKLITFPLGNRD